jgi:hypothetical protein
LASKTNIVIKRILTATALAIFMIACNDAGDKTVNTPVEDQPAEFSKGTGELVDLGSSRNIRDILCQEWTLEDDAASLEGMDETSTLDMPFRCFAFATNGTFVKNARNTFDHGDWSYDDAQKTIRLNNLIDKETDVYKIARITSEELILVNTGVGSTTNLKFIGPGTRLSNEAAEPFFIENNRWRIKPRVKETDSAIHNRLKQNLYFFVCFYRAVLAKNEQVVSFWGLPSCFKWYGGGIYLKKKSELKENWIDCFYDKEQAMKAYAIADRLLSQKYNWPKGERNWIKLNLAVLEQMYEKIDSVR